MTVNNFILFGIPYVIVRNLRSSTFVGTLKYFEMSTMDSGRVSPKDSERASRRDSSSDDGSLGDITIEVFSKMELNEVTLSEPFPWSLRTGEILSFINRRLIRSDVDYPVFLEMILNRLVRLTGSEIGNLSHQKGGKITCLALGESQFGTLNLDIANRKSPDGMFGHSITGNRIVISNNVPKDPRRKKTELPEGHPQIRTLLLIPIKAQWILSLANKDTYEVADVEELIPLIEVLGRILKKSHFQRKTLLDRSLPKNDIQNKFLAAMSHDLRTPLNGILGMATLLSDADSLTPKQKEYVTTIKECTFQMVTLVNNFLDFNKMASDSLILKKEPFRISDSVDEAMTIVRGNAINKGLDLDSRLPKKIPTLMGDRARLTQILSNLLGNAVKFTECGSVGLEIELFKIRKTRPQKWKIIFRVKDTGIGIPTEDQERIFEFFRQAQSLDTFLSRSGTGFGLSFSRELVRLMGGKISVESQVGKGSTFTFCVVMDEEVQSRGGGGLLKGKRVMIVDDRVEIRLQLSDILFKWGCAPVALGSAQEALQHLDYDSKFDIGFIDICMPNMTGIELAQEIRRKLPKLPLIGISSAEIMGGEEYFDFYTYKPIDQNTLFSMASKCLEGRSSKKRKSRRRLRILIAEDNQYNSFALKELLLSLGFKESRIKIVKDGRECVLEASRKKYDVILMDILMPIMDGIDASERILRTSNPPMIIAASAAVMSVDKARCQKVGISGYLEKPISKEKLDAALRPLVSRKKKHKGDKS